MSSISGAKNELRLWPGQTERFPAGWWMVISPVCGTSTMLSQRPISGAFGPTVRLRAALHSCRFTMGGLRLTAITMAVTIMSGRTHLRRGTGPRLSRIQTRRVALVMDLLEARCPADHRVARLPTERPRQHRQCLRRPGRVILKAAAVT